MNPLRCKILTFEANSIKTKLFRLVFMDPCASDERVTDFRADYSKEQMPELACDALCIGLSCSMTKRGKNMS